MLSGAALFRKEVAPLLLNNAENASVRLGARRRYFGKRKRKTSDAIAAETSRYVEGIIVTLEAAAEEDAELNRQSKPAINKLKKLPLLTEVLLKKHLQDEFLDHGVLGLLKSWLEPLPDGSLPNISVRTTILQILTDYPIDVGQFNTREQLKNSDIAANRKLARDLVDKWCRPIYGISTRFDQDMRSCSMVDEEKLLPKRQYVARPEPQAMDFTVRPQSKVNPAKNAMQDEVRSRLNKKLQRRTKSRRIPLQAAKLSAEGRNMLMIC
ncbi:hypothetical protein AQUCO_05400149v1 [Aquilegia coerulea]|uniref:TFIIS N-terminal domain-containing protein n=1 Tax=Aquilegia coerulea TaxID=218851 RepID=A0A2G5CHS6_AQUCA|nr:hypothetical protein AQUCO_05400149v1 [Aquilegia coerulea]